MAKVSVAEIKELMKSTGVGCRVPQRKRTRYTG